jgi:ketosteroid isomerase-like protein
MHEMTNDNVEGLRVAEFARCSAIKAQDFEKLQTLMHPSLIHVHTRGNQDTRESYLKYLSEVIEILDVRRGDLQISIYGECAVMTGRQYNTARLRGHEPIVEIEAQVMQVWAYEAGRWQQVAFQATATGALPPPIQSNRASK